MVGVALTSMGLGGVLQSGLTTLCGVRVGVRTFGVVPGE